MKAEIKALKTFRGREGQGFNLKLYVDSKYVAEVLDSADGGELRFYFKDDTAKTRLGLWVQSLPNDTHEEIAAECKEFGVSEQQVKQMLKLYPKGRPQSRDTAVCKLVDNFEWAKKLKRFCKTSIVFRVEGDAKGQWRRLTGAFSADVAQQLRNKFKGRSVEIANEKAGS